MRHPKILRQKLLQTAVLDKITREHLSVDTDEVRRSLQQIRAHVSRDTLMTSYLDQWEQLIEENDIDSIGRVVTSNDDMGNEMRNLSPLTVLLTRDERREILETYRDRHRR